VRNLFIAGLFLIIASCTSNTTDGFTTVKVKEVEQVGSYTYLLVKAKGPEYWVAVPSMEASPGETYKYQGGMLMQDFYSKELDRTFDKVVFLEAIFAENNMPAPAPAPQAEAHGGKVAVEKSSVNLEAGEGTITITELFSNPDSYMGKTIRVKGEVTKFNPAIMGRNWVHLQDGTEFEGKYDLTATSIESFEEGGIVTLEGILAVNKDFGYGYSYEILLEKATAVN
jgi:hypothetical protein